jgi:Putative prokaryotic signal transducing protein
MLAEAGIPAAILDDSAPGVPAGAYEVRVDAENQARAEDLIAHFSPDEELEEVDPSHALDLVTVFGEEGSGSEMEAMQIQSILEAGGISAVVIGDSRYPIFGQQVRVAREQEARARQLIEEAQAAGPAGAEAAEEDTTP